MSENQKQIATTVAMVLLLGGVATNLVTTVFYETPFVVGFLHHTAGGAVMAALWIFDATKRSDPCATCEREEKSEFGRSEHNSY